MLDTWLFTINDLEIALPVVHERGDMFLIEAEALEQEQRDLIAEQVTAHVDKQLAQLRRAADA